MKPTEKELSCFGNASSNFDELVKYCELVDLVEVWKPKHILHVGHHKPVFEVVMLGLRWIGGYINAATEALPTDPQHLIDLLLVESTPEGSKTKFAHLFSKVAHGGVVVIDGESKMLEKLLYAAGFLELNRFINCSFYRKP